MIVVEVRLAALIAQGEHANMSDALRRAESVKARLSALSP